MFLLNSPELPNKNNIVSISTLPSSGASDDPLRTLIYQPKKDETFYLLIARRATDSNPPNTLKWISSANGADRTITYEYIDNNSLNDTVYGQANASQSISVGASNPDNPQNVRTYTSKGSSPIVFDTDGNRLSSPVLRNKPEIFAPDGVETTFSSETLFNPFRGSSASAPHVAGVVALMLERAGGNLTSERVRSILQATASPVTQDAGFVRADSAITDSFFSTRKGTKTSNILQGTSFADNLYGKKGSDILKGYQGKDYLVGGSGADLLLGGSENDVLIGGSDSNLLSGGKGNDSFVLEPKGFSIIKDFEIEKDLLAFSGIKDTQNITFLPKANDTLVKYSGDSLAMLVDVEIGDKIRTTFI
jgi:Ca2+-binding RTX toxin-like protein